MGLRLGWPGRPIYADLSCLPLWKAWAGSWLQPMFQISLMTIPLLASLKPLLPWNYLPGFLLHKPHLWLTEPSPLPSPALFLICSPDCREDTCPSAPSRGTLRAKRMGLGWARRGAVCLIRDVVMLFTNSSRLLAKSLELTQVLHERGC